MKPSAFLGSLNRLPLWQRPVRVWDFRLTPPTFDRWLYLWMHRLHRMGGKDRTFFRQVIRPGMHVADVGANLGLYSLMFAQLVGPEGHVYAFEPDELMVRYLRANLAANGVAHAEVFACAVGAGAGRAFLQRHAVNSGDNRLGTAATALHCDQASVEVCALQDALRGRRVDFIKMDLQGWDGEALRGISGLLDANPALQICFEFWPHGLNLAGTTLPGLAETLRHLGLRVSLAEPGPAATPVDIETLAPKMKPGTWVNLLATR